MANEELKSVAALVEAVGGVERTAQALGCRPKQIYSWRSRGAIAAKMFVAHQAALEALGIRASPVIWRQNTNQA